MVVEGDLVQASGKLAANLQGMVVLAGITTHGFAALLVAINVDLQRLAIVGAHDVVPLVLDQRRHTPHHSVNRP